MQKSLTTAALLTSGCLTFNPGYQPESAVDAATRLRQAEASFEPSAEDLRATLEQTQLDTRRFLSVVSLRAFLDTIDQECALSSSGAIQMLNESPVTDYQGNFLTDHPRLDQEIAAFTTLVDADRECLFKAIESTELPGTIQDQDGDNRVDVLYLDADAPFPGADNPATCNIGFVPIDNDKTYAIVASCGLPEDNEDHSIIAGSIF